MIFAHLKWFSCDYEKLKRVYVCPCLRFTCEFEWQTTKGFAVHWWNTYDFEVQRRVGVWQRMIGFYIWLVIVALKDKDNVQYFGLIKLIICPIVVVFDDFSLFISMLIMLIELFTISNSSRSSFSACFFFKLFTLFLCCLNPHLTSVMFYCLITCSRPEYAWNDCHWVLNNNKPINQKWSYIYIDY